MVQPAVQQGSYRVHYLQDFPSLRVALQPKFQSNSNLPLILRDDTVLQSEFWRRPRLRRRISSLVFAMNRLTTFLRRHSFALGALVLLVALGACCLSWIVVHGISARDQPTAAESILARALRHAATPRAARNLANPVPLSAVALEEGRMHWADHCALCHGNDGKGMTEIGRNLYPKAPDMTAAATQGLNDGELFSIIKNGVRLTGMPAWGDNSSAGDEQSWKLVLFIRHLPMATQEELDQMRTMNPISPMERQEAKAEDDFLNGTEAPTVGGTPTPTARKEHR